MFRIILFLVLIALAAAGAAWVADQPGDVVISWGVWRASPSVPVFVLVLGLTIVAVVFAWSLLRGLWGAPKRMRRRRHEKRQARGRQAITHGLLAIGQGDGHAARRHADIAKRLTADDPLALLLHAQSAQLDGDRAGAHRAFQAMAERSDTRLLGLRGLFIEAQRSDDPVAAVTIAEEALKLSPASTWASQAVLGFRCAQSDWTGALKILDNNFASGLIDRAAFRRQRGVLLTARALELETQDRDLSRDSVTEAIKLAPTLVPAAVLASRFQSEAHQTRRAMKIIETAWLAQPHPDLADAYAHVKLGDSARQRLVRVETLASKAPGHIEGALAIARAAIDAAEFTRAREALAPFTADSTQRVAMLMAEIERTEHGDSGRARAWTLRAVRALHDPVWTADGYVSDRWRPVSPVTGRIDAFQWQTPLAALPSDRASTIETEILRETVLAPPPAMPKPVVPVPVEVTPSAPAQDLAVEPEVPAQPEPVADAAPEPAEAPPPLPKPAPAPPPLFRDRSDIASAVKPAVAIPAVIPIVRPPDDPGVDEADDYRDEFAELNAGQQQGGWRGFLRRWGG
ncbi:heme biosynthesis protein HemY [Tardiphaga sp. 42S5]|uniref:heme biosynthesis protein HemY n=1 Tax=Tardiphaga sp. 42S5 TaxID=1404799 RepID=UPI002A5A7283|nr:heme biosynthesis HemY N-terminal domain-containing protein [Tardiphaga sp. 42S5]WPO42244.1 heme biosynthesis HemY N-terminal domain-containing protein [Tardiphaga sp. 42S5]